MVKNKHLARSGRIPLRVSSLETRLSTLFHTLQMMDMLQEVTTRRHLQHMPLQILYGSRYGSRSPYSKPFPLSSPSQYSHVSRNPLKQPT
ncbi:hypothetical protein HYS47_00100 [Candidatus Woesearchaeota archaeon]|nr:hypothetical protein [Candidatus Woesearchaeota archaeon]